MTVTDAARSYLAFPRTAAATPAERSVADRVLAATLVLAVAGVALQTVVDLVGVWALNREVELLLADSDAGVFAWASVVATFAAALAALLLSAVSGAQRRLLVLVSGSEKADAVVRALEDEPLAPTGVPPLPARLARRGTWLLDRAAAAKLGAR